MFRYSVIRETGHDCPMFIHTMRGYYYRNWRETPTPRGTRGRPRKDDGNVATYSRKSYNSILPRRSRSKLERLCEHRRAISHSEAQEELEFYHKGPLCKAHLKYNLESIGVLPDSTEADESTKSPTWSDLNFKTKKDYYRFEQWFRKNV